MKVALDIGVAKPATAEARLLRAASAAASAGRQADVNELLALAATAHGESHATVKQYLFDNAEAFTKANEHTVALRTKASVITTSIDRLRYEMLARPGSPAASSAAVLTKLNNVLVRQRTLLTVKEHLKRAVKIRACLDDCLAATLVGDHTRSAKAVQRACVLARRGVEKHPRLIVYRSALKTACDARDSLVADLTRRFGMLFRVSFASQVDASDPQIGKTLAALCTLNAPTQAVLDTLLQPLHALCLSKKSVCHETGTLAIAPDNPRLLRFVVARVSSGKESTDVGIRGDDGAPGTAQTGHLSNLRTYLLFVAAVISGDAPLGSFTSLASCKTIHWPLLQRVQQYARDYIVLPAIPNQRCGLVEFRHLAAHVEDSVNKMAREILQLEEPPGATVGGDLLSGNVDVIFARGRTAYLLGQVREILADEDADRTETVPPTAQVEQSNGDGASEMQPPLLLGAAKPYASEFMLNSRLLSSCDPLPMGGVSRVSLCAVRFMELVEREVLPELVQVSGSGGDDLIQKQNQEQNVARVGLILDSYLLIFAQRYGVCAKGDDGKGKTGRESDKGALNNINNDNNNDGSDIDVASQRRRRVLLAHTDAMVLGAWMTRLSVLHGEYARSVFAHVPCFIGLAKHTYNMHIVRERGRFYDALWPLEKILREPKKHFGEIEARLRYVVSMLQEVCETAQDVLPVPMCQHLASTVYDYVLEFALGQILAWRDIAADDCTLLGTLLRMVQVPECGDVDGEGTSSVQKPTRNHRKWQKSLAQAAKATRFYGVFVEAVDILELSLREIRARFEAGRYRGFQCARLVGLVEALFQESPQRRSLVMDIYGGAKSGLVASPKSIIAGGNCST